MLALIPDPGCLPDRRERLGGQERATGVRAGPSWAAQDAAGPALSVAPEYGPRPVPGEDLWRWQKQNPSGFGTQA